MGRSATTDRYIRPLPAAAYDLLRSSAGARYLVPAQATAFFSSVW